MISALPDSSAAPRRVDRAARLVAAQPPEVYAAFTDPKALVQWLPPAGATMQVDAFEPRPGGALRLILTFAETTSGQGKSSDRTDVVNAKFVALDPPSQIVWDIDFDSDRPEFAGTMRMTWDLLPANTGTEVRITAADVPPGITAEAHQQGLTSSLANLARFVERR
ncbi:SRPBCC domain-containing protein [Pseudoruegeria sp. HB172150]|uniref:SRPBCC domain-containing protein n=1 Tax=Pseudoruegeria sp. HB172150 TaxID=2721164 RepID=UPI001C131D07|nr:SRPBCC domain-containing protein [Pseudoruegeria sp. HB172150]